MNTSDIQNILRITVLASFADGAKHDRERDAIKNIADSLGQAEGVNLPSLYQDALLKRVNLEQAAAALSNDEARHLAYEMAVCVCDADGSTSEAERVFLRSLQQALALPASEAQAFDQQAAALVPVDLPATVQPLPADAGVRSQVDRAARGGDVGGQFGKGRHRKDSVVERERSLTDPSRQRRAQSGCKQFPL